MGLFDKLKEPVFYKDDSTAEEQLNALMALKELAGDSVPEALEQEIKLVQAGIYGEKQIRFELENSHIPMYVLHDLCLEYNGLSAQIDYLLITRKHQFVLECKNLYGNIEIDHNGNFIRTFYFGKFAKKEGIYSPVTQNRRHLELIREMRRIEHKSILVRAAFEKRFFFNYRGVVVLANCKSVLNDKKAPEEIKKQVIRADRLIEYIRKVDSNPDDPSSSDKSMEDLARYFLEHHKENDVDYTERFRKMIEESTQQSIAENVEETSPKEAEPQDETILCPKCGAPMVKRQAKRGAQAGTFFYGCSNFPRCRSIINIE